MSRERSELTPLESRKQLLILESELNRALLVKEMGELKGEIHKVALQARSMGSVINTAADLAGAFATLGHAVAPKNENGRPQSWLSTIINTVRAGASLWQAFRERGK